MRYRRGAIIACVLLFAVHSQASEISQTIRYQGLKVTSNLLLYFNPNVDHYERFAPAHAQRYQRSMNRLGTLVEQSGDRQLSDLYAQLHARLTRLEQAKAESLNHARWINAVLASQAALDLRAAELEVLSEDTFQQNATTLLLQLQQMNLLYQTRTFGSLQVFLQDLGDDPFITLDQRIVTSFEELSQLASPEHQDIIEAARRDYTFIRRSLLVHGEDWVQGSVAYYLSRISQGLEPFTQTTQRQ